MTQTTTDAAVRAVFITGFRALADFLEAHPDLPVPRFSVHDGLTVYPAGCDADKRAEVDRVAVVLDAIPDGHGLYQACRRFGDCVAYRIVAVPASAEADADTAGEG
jgi:hypothetical protein